MKNSVLMNNFFIICLPRLTFKKSSSQDKMSSLKSPLFGLSPSPIESPWWYSIHFNTSAKIVEFIFGNDSTASFSTSKPWVSNNVLMRPEHLAILMSVLNISPSDDCKWIVEIYEKKSIQYTNNNFSAIIIKTKTTKKNQLDLIKRFISQQILIQFFKHLIVLTFLDILKRGIN